MNICVVDQSYRTMKIYTISYMLLIPCLAMGQTEKTLQRDTLKKALDTVKIANDSLSIQNKIVRLNEVVIKSTRPLIQMEIDRTVVNVASMISSASSNTLEVLEKTPGVTVDAQGNISLNGRSGVMVLIDGKQMYLSGSDLAAYLKSLPGGNLDKIELMDNPPARYDAAGNGIINIRLKKNRTAGMTGSVATGYNQGRYARTNNSINLNYSNKKINIFSNVGYSYDKNYGIDIYKRTYYDAGGTIASSILLDNEQQYYSNGFNGNLGMDYSPSDNTTYGLQLNLSTSTNDGRASSLSRNFGLVELDSSGRGLSIADGTRQNIGSNLNVLHRFGKTGRELSADAGYLRNTGSLDQSFENKMYETDGSMASRTDLFYDLPTYMTVYTIKSDYVHPLANKVKVEAGLKWSLVENDHENDAYLLSGNQQLIDHTRSNHFKYQEGFAAAYVSGQKTWKQLGIQLGLRAEHTYGLGQQLGNTVVSGSTFENQYTRLFPTVFINYKLDTVSANTLNFSLTRRINRPNYQYMNPFVFVRDQFTQTTGNPDILPQYQYRYELRWQHKRFLRMAVSYNRFTNVIFQTTNVVNGIFITRPENVKQGYMFITSTGLTLDPFNWWNFNAEIWAARLGLEGTAYGEQLNPKIYAARINVINQLRFGKGWSGEFGGYYASRDLNGQTVTAGMIRTNAELQKKIWKDKGSIRLNMEDIFHSWKYENSSVSLKQAYFFQTSESDTQRIGFSFTYNFGNELFARKSKHRNNALDEEKSRM
ncbi:MAG: hypothetical protein EOO88_06245 [Pedobacter sp.]|nr:MAG: hypothetical protein EOO88_06245 [Pedobacter sp.]